MTDDGSPKKPGPVRQSVPREGFPSVFAAWLSAARQDAGLSVEQLAAKSGVAESTIYAYEAALKKPQLEQTIMLASALGRSLAEFDEQKKSQEKPRHPE